jgi:hypothetical protein
VQTLKVLMGMAIAAVTNASSWQALKQVQLLEQLQRNTNSSTNHSTNQSGESENNSNSVSVPNEINLRGNIGHPTFVFPETIFMGRGYGARFSTEIYTRGCH